MNSLLLIEKASHVACSKIHYFKYLIFVQLTLVIVELNLGVDLLISSYLIILGRFNK